MAKTAVNIVFSHQAFRNLLTDGINVQMNLDDTSNKKLSSCWQTRFGFKRV